MARKDAKRVAAGKRSRAKGKVWERAVVRLLKPLWARAHRGHQDARGGFGGGEGCDVEGTPFYMECRHEQAWNWRRHLREALTMRAKRRDSRLIVLIAKEDKKPTGWRPGRPGQPPVALMLLDEWLQLAHEIAKWRKLANSVHADECNQPPWDYVAELLGFELPNETDGGHDE